MAKSKHPYWADTDELMILFPCYKSKASLYNAIHLGNFPVPTFREGGKRYAEKEVLRRYFLKKRKEAILAQEAASK